MTLTPRKDPPWDDTIAKLRQRIAELEAENRKQYQLITDLENEPDACEQDAARWQKFRKGMISFNAFVEELKKQPDNLHISDRFDAAIDAAIQAEGEKK